MEPLTTFEIITRILYQFIPVWISMLVVFLASISFKDLCTVSTFLIMIVLTAMVTIVARFVIMVFVLAVL